MSDSKEGSVHPVDLWRDALGGVLASWQRMLAIHIIFALLGVVLFAPLLGIASRLLLRFAGEPAVADQDIAVFLLSPFGIFSLIVFTALFIGIIIFEQTAMMRVSLGESRNERVRVRGALGFTAARSPAVLLFSAHLVARLLVIVLPILAIGAWIASRTITEYDINYYLSEKPPEFIRAVALIGIVVAAGAAVLVRKLIGWSIALPLVLFAGVHPGRSFSASTRTVSGSRTSVLLSFLLWALSTLAVGAIVLGVVRLIGGVAVPMVADDLSVLVVVLALLAVLLTAANLLVTAGTSAHFAALTSIIFERYARSADYPIRVSPVQPDQFPLFIGNRLAFGLLAAAAVAITLSAWMVNDIQIEDDVLIIAHRGAAGRAPENTLASVQAALEDDTDWIEIDVQESADGEVIVVHDSDFMKLSGNPVKVWDVTNDQLAEIDVGRWFASEFAGEGVPTLRQVLEMARGNATVVIELKYYGHDQDLEARVANIVEATGMTEQVALMSLKYAGARKMKQLRPDWTVGLLSATAIGDLSRLEADFLAVSTSMASRGFVERAHAEGKRVFAWTVNDPVTMSTVLSRGVDGIITDEPAMAREVLADRAELNTVERLLLLASSLFGRDFSSREYRDNSP
jgi:glycerophosphoryl diester phosphodiesterase